MVRDDDVVFVGINPSGSGDSRGRTMDRFRGWCDYLGLGFVSFTNLHGDEDWDKRISTIDKDLLLSSIVHHKKIIALGSLPSKVLTKMNVEHFHLPHPSPLNRLINDPGYIRSCLDECKEYIYSC